METKKEYISYQGIEYYYNRLIDELEKLDIIFDYIYGIPKGGLPMAVHLANYYDISLLLTTDKINSFTNKNILIVDDIADAGSTMTKVMDKIKNSNNNITTLCIFKKDRSTFTPDVSLPIADNIWVVFPWEPTESKYNNTEIV